MRHCFPGQALNAKDAVAMLLTHLSNKRAALAIVQPSKFRAAGFSENRKRVNLLLCMLMLTPENFDLC